MSFLDNIKAIPITDYASRCGYTLVREGTRYYSLREHDSVMIDIQKNCFWRNSVFQRGQHGSAGSIIDFVMEFSGCDRNKALRELALMYGIEGEKAARVEYKTPVAKKAEMPKREAGDLDLPPRANNDRAAFHYLYRVRMLDLSVIRYFHAKGMFYQDKEHTNCVFLANKFACVRSTGGERFAIDVPGCDYNECFFFRPTVAAKTLIVAESVIDIMSIMTQFVREKKRYTDYCYLALAGTNKLFSLFYHLQNEKGIDAVLLAFDNDNAGRTATEAAKEELIEKGYNGRFSCFNAPSGKDWNDYIKLTSSR
ncbi:hypothetical protein OBV_p-00140 (plasmid) [Oscillibacter valericigenes Sjm18-20]|nr:hypothetical protein OBV_p-00140 [Oscillibacter valericigenes Sjm18-20]